VKTSSPIIRAGQACPITWIGAAGASAAWQVMISCRIGSKLESVTGWQPMAAKNCVI
jgi:hypothetical protein